MGGSAELGHGSACLCTVGLGCAWCGAPTQSCTPSGWAVCGFPRHGLLAQGCAWFGSHARGCTWPGWAVRSCGGSASMHMVVHGQAGLCTGWGSAGPPSRCRLRPHQCRISTLGLRHLSGHRGTHCRGLCLEDGCALWEQSGGLSRTRWLPWDCSFPAALPRRFAPPAPSLNLALGDLTHCILHPAQLVCPSLTPSRTTATAQCWAQLWHRFGIAVPLCLSRRSLTFSCSHGWACRRGLSPCRLNLALALTLPWGSEQGESGQNSCTQNRAARQEPGAGDSLWMAGL